ncbi:MAG TPA: hypothetical protein VJR02_03235 [Pyrinomonadaceae bacterium]|nr:hypothetical protein [Pyrinomonadaceae bacterium]
MEKRWIVLALLALLQTLPVAGPVNGQKSQRNSKTSEARKTQEERLQILQQELPKLADSALALQNLELKIETLGRLADLSWSHDALSARQLFQRTYELLRSIEPADDRLQSKQNEATARLQRTKLIGLYIRFFSRVAKHEPAWKEQLLKDAPEFLSDPAVARDLDLNTASLLIQERDPKAFDYIESGISNSVSGLANTMQVLDLLLKFRQLDSKKADQLFIQLMRQMENQSVTTADDLLTIGNYLFSGHRAADKPEDKVLISPVFVGRIAFHADISYDRPGNSPETVDHYLRSSVSILTRPVDSEPTQLQNRAAAFLLLPKSRRFAPDLVPILNNLSTGIDPKRTNSVELRAFTPEPSEPPTLETVAEALDKIKDSLKRDEYCLRMIWSFYQAADFKSASALTDRMTSVEARNQLSTVIPVGQAINSLQTGDLDAARLQIQRLTEGKDRSFLGFALASRLIEKGDVQSGRVAIDGGLSDARRTDGSVKASLLLIGSELTSTLDFPAGLRILSEALNVTNSFDPDLMEPLRLDRFVRVRVGSQSATFSTDVTGFKFGSFSGAFKAPISKDPTRALALILHLKNEYMRSSALLVFVAALAS